MRSLHTSHAAAALFGSLLAAAGALAADSTAAAPDTRRPTVLVRSKTDTVLLIRDGDVENVLSNIGEKIDLTRRRGYGGAGGPTPGLMLMDMGPVIDIVERDEKFAGKGFNISRYSLTTGSGGMGYGGIGNGIRIGGGGFGGHQQLISKYTGADGRDSVAIVDVDYSYGGFLIEKCFVREKLNTVVGGMMGSGTYQISGTVVRDSALTAFSDADDKFAGEEISGINLTVYGGATYTIISWFHMGADLSLSGFFGRAPARIAIATQKSNFFGITPSFKIRFMFGNLG